MSCKYAIDISKTIVRASEANVTVEENTSESSVVLETNVRAVTLILRMYNDSRVIACQSGRIFEEKATKSSHRRQHQRHACPLTSVYSAYIFALQTKLRYTLIVYV